MNSAVMDELRHEANAKLDPKKKGALGQFMTPSRIADFMANMFTNRKNAVLLDAGAGIGSLTLAASKVLKLKRVEAWEIEPVLQSYLETNLASLNVPHELHKADFIIDSALRLLEERGTRFTHAILNPPYKKIGTSSVHRQACKQIGLETVNLYTAFLALAILQMQDGGEIVIIIPRSFCNGPYYKPFRELMLKECSIDMIHVFESRSKAFKDDEVLQENIILKLTRQAKQGQVILSSSHDSKFEDLLQRTVDYKTIIEPNDKEFFIRIPEESGEELSEVLYNKSLKEMGIDVCTGPVVSHRVKEWLSQDMETGMVPLIFPHHFVDKVFAHPKTHKKPNALIRSQEVDKWLMVEGNYVLIKRFSAKEERRRVVAYLVTPEDTKSELVGFENHWNVLHIKKRGLDRTAALGLACFLNSTALDGYFRIFSGHTQVNATDLRNMKFPKMADLERLGRSYKLSMKQDEIDALIKSL